MDDKTFDFSDAEQEDWFTENLLQGAEFYYALDGRSRIIVAIGGRIFTLEPVMEAGAEVFTVTEITPTGSTTTTAGFVVPAVDSTVTISLTSTAKVWIGYPINVNGSVYVVTAITGNDVTARNVTGTPAAVVAGGVAVLYLDPNAPEMPMVWMEQAEQYMVIQDGQAAAIIYDGGTSRRAEREQLEVPTGTAMVYNEEIGRLAVAVSGNQIAIGDIAGGTSSVIRFEEETVLATGGRFRVPLKFGKIVALEMTANLDRSNGQGPMIAFAERGLSSFVLPASRLQWQTVSFALQINMALKYSATSQAGVVTVNSDLYFRAKDGLRSLIYAVRDFQNPGNVPVSSEMGRVLDRDDVTLLDRCSSVLFDNRLILTAAPAPSANGIYHRGLVVMDFDVVSRMGQKAPPVYDGLWTGVRTTRLLVGSMNGKERCFLFTLDATTNLNELWELEKRIGYDGPETRVQSGIETRAFDAGRPLELKKLWDLDIWLDRLVGQVNITAQWRPDDYHNWLTIGSRQITVTDTDCITGDECQSFQVLNAGYATRISFGQPPESDESVDNKPARNFYHAQFRITWTGQCRIRKMVAHLAQPEEVVSNVSQHENNITVSDTTCLPDDYSYAA